MNNFATTNYLEWIIMLKPFKKLAAALAVTAAFSVSAFANDPIVIKFSHVVANETPKGQGALMFQN